MMHPTTTRLILFCTTIAAIVVLAPWLASRSEGATPGLFTQICTSLGITPPPAAAPLPHPHH